MEVLFKSILLTSLFWGFYKIFLEKNTFFQWNRVYLIMGIIFAFILPFIVIPVKVIIPLNQALNEVDSINNSIKHSNTFWGNLNFLTFLGLIYVGGVLVMFVRLSIQFWSLKQFLQKLPQTKNGKILLSETDKSITSFSFFKHIVVSNRNVDPQELTQIIEHETVHAHQWHSVDLVLSQLLIILQWFNPLAWNYKKLLEQNLEFIADQQVVIKSSSHDTYTQLLLKNSVENYPFILTNSFNNSLLKKRIIMLHTPQTLNIHRWKLVLILPILALFIYAFNRIEKPVYQDVDKQFETVNAINPMDFSVTITKESTDADLKAVEQMLASQDVKFDLKKIKRNAKNEIIAIAIEVKGKNFNTNFDNDNNDGIDPILIQFSAKDQKIKIGNFNPSPEKQWTQKKNVKVIKNGENEEENIILIESNDDEDQQIKTIKVIASDSLKVGGKKIVLTKEDQENGENELQKYTIIVEGDEDGVTKCIINGKEVSKEEMEKINPSQIKEVHVIKKKKSDK